MRLPKEKYVDKTQELLHKEIEDLAAYYGKLAEEAKKKKNNQNVWYYNGIVEGLNKVWKLTFVDGVTVKELKKYI